MPRFAVDYLDVLTTLLRTELPDVTVMTRNPDRIPDHLPLVTLWPVGGDSLAPEFYDTPWINVQTWCEEDRVNNLDASRLASNLADDVRRVLWTAYRTQQVVHGLGWISWIRESAGPREVPDLDLHFLGRFSATYELRIRSAA